MTLLERLRRVDFGRGLTEVMAALRVTLKNGELAAGLPNHNRTVLVGGGSGTPAAARALATVGIQTFTTLANTFDRARDPETLELRGCGLVRAKTGGPDWVDVSTQLTLSCPEARRTELHTLLMQHVGDVRLVYMVLQVVSELTGVQGAVDWLGHALGNPWRVVPSTIDPTEVKLVQGERIFNVYAFAREQPHKDRIPDTIFLDPPARLSGVAREALGYADNLIIGPGDVHVSVLPHWLVTGFREVLQHNAELRLILVVNLTTRQFDTPRFTLKRFLDLWSQYLPFRSKGGMIALVHNGVGDILNRLMDDVAGDRYEHFQIVRRDIAGAHVSRNQQPLHDETRFGQALLELLR